MDPVVHFEMPYDDAARLTRFYQSVFRWRMKVMGEDMGSYVLATTAGSSADGRPEKPGVINGGFFPKKPDWPAQHPSVVIAVVNIRKAMDSVTRAGGHVLGEPMDIPGVGAYVSFTDTEGNRVSLLQPLPRAKAEARPKSRTKAKAKAKAKAKKRPAAKKPASRRGKAGK